MRPLSDDCSFAFLALVKVSLQNLVVAAETILSVDDCGTAANCSFKRDISGVFKDE